MIFEVTINADGSLVTEVIDRGEHLCKEVYTITAKLGTMVSDEELYDPSSTVHITGENG